MTDKPEQFQLKWKAIALVMMMVCASVLMTAHAMGSGSGGNSIPVVIESGSGVETASYIIYKDGDYTCLKNGTTGRVELRNENASYIIQTAIDWAYENNALKVFIRSGTYEIDSQITISAPVTLMGEGRGDYGIGGVGVDYGTILLSKTNIDSLILIDTGNYTMTNGVTISDMVLLGHWANGSYDGADIGIDMQKGSRTNIENLLVARFAHYGVRIMNGIHSIGIDGCHINSNGNDSADHGGIFIYEGQQINIRDSQIEWCGSGILLRSGYNLVVSGTTIEGNNYFGVDALSYPSNTYQHVTLDNVYYEANNLAESENISDVAFGMNDAYWIIANNKFASYETDHAIYVGGWGAYIVDTATITAPKIYVDANGGRGTIIHSGSVDPSSFPNMLHWLVDGQYLSRKGSVSFGNGQVNYTLPHFLAAAPSIIMITGTTANSGGAFISMVNATHFTITLPSASVGTTLVYYEVRI